MLLTLLRSAAPATRPWVPTDLPNLLVWLNVRDGDADLTYATGANVSRWANRATGNDAIEAAFYPDYSATGMAGNLPAVRFAPGDAMYLETEASDTTNSVWHAPFTAAGIFRHNVTPWTGFFGTYPCTDPNPGMQVIAVQSSHNMAFAEPIRQNTDGQSGLQWNAGTPATTPNIIVFRSATGITSTGLTANFTNNGSALSPNCSLNWVDFDTLNLVRGICLGRPNYDIGGGFDLGEFVFCTSALSESDRQKLEGYLAWNWGRQGDLPAGHPYKLAAPTVPLGGSSFDVLITELAALAEAQVGGISLVSILSEAALGGDSVTGTSSRTGAVTEPAATADAQAAALGAVAAGTEPATPGDAAATSLAALAALTEPAASADAATGGLALVSAATESAPAGDTSTSGSARTGAVTEAASTTDAVLNSLAAIAAALEAASTADAAANTAALLAARTEPAATGDASLGAVGTSAAATESAPAGDSVAGTSARLEIVTESVTLADAVGSALAALAAALENVAPSDAAGNTATRVAALSEPLSPGDALSGGLALGVTAIEASPAGDSIAATTINLVAASETTNPDDAPSATQIATRQVVEGLALGEILIQFGDDVVENASAADVLSAGVALVAARAEAVTLADAAAPVILIVGIRAEAITPADAAGSTVAATGAVVEVSIATEAVAGSFSLNVAITEGMTLAELASAISSALRLVSDFVLAVRAVDVAGIPVRAEDAPTLRAADESLTVISVRE